MASYLLAYLFVCFSIGVASLGLAVVVVLKMKSRVARAFLAFYAALSVVVLASLLLAFLDVLPNPVAPELRAALEYLEAIVGFYGLLFTLPYFAHRLFAVQGVRRDWVLLGVVLLAVVVQHWTEYGPAPQWDARGDFLENLLFVAMGIYVLALGLSRLRAPGVDRKLASRFLLLLCLGIPGFLHDLFLIEVTSLRVYPLWYVALSLVLVWTLYRHSNTAPGPVIPAAWNLSDREAEVAELVVRGLSNKEIASKLNISSNTVKTHLRAVFGKSGARSRFALMSMTSSARPGELHSAAASDQNLET